MREQGQIRDIEKKHDWVSMTGEEYTRDQANIRLAVKYEGRVEVPGVKRPSPQGRGERREERYDGGSDMAGPGSHIGSYQVASNQFCVAISSMGASRRT